MVHVFHWLPQLDSKHEAASAYVDSANCYKKVSSQGSFWVPTFKEETFDSVIPLSSSILI